MYQNHTENGTLLALDRRSCFGLQQRCWGRTSSRMAFASGASATSCSSGFDKHLTLGERGVKQRSASLSPFVDLRLAEDQHVDWPAQVVQRAPQTDHLSVPVGYLWLDHEEVEIAAGTRVTARVRAEQDHSDWRACGLGQDLRCMFDVCVDACHVSLRGLGLRAVTARAGP
jgi:hypothetical protein